MFSFLKDLSPRKVFGGGVLAFVLIVVLILGFMSTEKVSQGHIGVVYSAGNGVEETTLDDGWHIVAFWKKVTEYPVALETVEYEKVSLATKDGKPVSFDMTFNYSNDAEKVTDIYTKFKGAKPSTIESTFILSRAKESALSVTSKYTVLDVFQKREEIKTEIAQRFTEDLKQYGFIVSDFVLGTPAPDEKTAQAIQSVVDKQQELEALKIETQKAEEEAKRQLVEAEGIANAQIEKARGASESNKLMEQSLTPQILKKMELEARSKHGWITITGATPVVTTDK